VKESPCLRWRLRDASGFRNFCSNFIVKLSQSKRECGALLRPPSRAARRRGVCIDRGKGLNQFLHCIPIRPFTNSHAGSYAITKVLIRCATERRAPLCSHTNWLGVLARPLRNRCRPRSVPDMPSLVYRLCHTLADRLTQVSLSACPARPRPASTRQHFPRLRSIRKRTPNRPSRPR